MQDLKGTLAKAALIPTGDQKGNTHAELSRAASVAPLTKSLEIVMHALCFIAQETGRILGC